MKCPSCNHVTEGGRFCENCGRMLVEEQTQTTEQQVGTNQGPAQQDYTQTQDIPLQKDSLPNQPLYADQEVAAAVNAENATKPKSSNQGQQYLESTKKISKLYFNFFVDVIKNPFATTKAVGSDHFVNAIITMVIYALLIPLMFYFGLRGIYSDLGSFGSLFGDSLNSTPPIFDSIIKPLFAYAGLIALVATFTFLALKLGKEEVAYKDVFSRFGSMLIPSVAIFAVAFVLSLFKTDLYLFLYNLGFAASIYLAPPLVISSFKKESNNGLDLLHGTLLTYLLTFIVMYILGDLLFDTSLVAFTKSIF